MDRKLQADDMVSSVSTEQLGPVFTFAWFPDLRVMEPVGTEPSAAFASGTTKAPSETGPKELY